MVRGGCDLMNRSCIVVIVVVLDAILQQRGHLRSDLILGETSRPLSHPRCAFVQLVACHAGYSLLYQCCCY
jgi:hypothetical protein